MPAFRARSNPNPAGRHRPIERAPRIFVNNLAGIYRLDGGLISTTFVSQFCDPHLNAVEQPSLIWPEAPPGTLMATCCNGCSKKSRAARLPATCCNSNLIDQRRIAAKLIQC
jgi:hypothetical protein